MSDFTTTFGDTTLVLTNDQDIELGTAQLGDQFGTIKRAIIRRTGDREIIAHAKTKQILMVLIHNPGFEMQLECAFAKSVTAPGLGESLSLPLVGVTGFVMEGVTVQWEAGSERGLSIPVSSWDIMQGATAYRLTPTGELVTLGAAGHSAPTAAPTLTGAVTSSSISTAWTTVARAETYQLQVSTDGSTWSDLSTGTAQLYSLTGLTTSATRHFRVRARNSAGDGPWSDVLELETTAVAPTTAPTLSGSALTTAYSLGLSWNTNINGAESYELQVSTDGGSTYSTLSDQTGGNYTHAIGSAGTSRKYRVRATNSVGDGPWSTVRTLVTTSLLSPALSVTVGATSLNLNWTTQSLAADYEAQRSDDAGATWEALVITGGASHSDADMAAGDTLHYRVRARNSVETGPWSNVAAATLADLGVPSISMAPQAHSLLLDVILSVVPGATGYEVQFGPNSDFSGAVTYSTANGGLTSYPTQVNGGLGAGAYGAETGNQLIYARARAMSGSTPGDWSGSVSATTAPAAPEPDDWDGLTAHWGASAGADRYVLYLGGVYHATTTATSYDFTSQEEALEANQEVTLHARRDADGADSPYSNLGVPA